MPVSNKLRMAIGAFADKVSDAISHVSAANYAEREREARVWVHTAYKAVADAMESNDKDLLLVDWQRAVATGATELSYADWSSTQ